MKIQKAANQPRGFTMIEIMIVVAVVGILSIILSDALIQTLRGENKVKVINQVKQNGQSVMDKLSNETRQARRVVCIARSNVLGATEIDTIVLQTKTDNFVRFRLYQPTSTANGKIVRNEFTLADAAALYKTEPEYCLDISDYDPSRVYSLTDTDTLNGVSVTYYDDNVPVFEEKPKPGFYNTVTIKFKAQQAVKKPAIFDTQVEENFVTTVQVMGQIIGGE